MGKASSPSLRQISGPLLASEVGEASQVIADLHVVEAVGAAEAEMDGW